MPEVWKDVVDFEGLYQVSNHGKFRRHPDKQSKNKYRITKSLDRKTQLNRDGYVLVDLCKENNAVSNLLPCSSQQNNLHQHRTGLAPKPGRSIYHNVHIRLSKYKDTVYTYYVAKVKDMRKVIFMKQFKNEIDAAHAVDQFLDSIGDTQRARNFP